MYNIKYIILFLLFSSTSFCGCDNFLEEDPQSLVVIDVLDEDIVESLIIGMYEPLTRSRGRLWESHWGRTLLLLEEHAHSRSGLEDVANYNFSASPLMINAGWATIYESISGANTIIKLVNGSDDLDGDVITKATAEAEFVRAFCYFQLVRLYGEVPLRLTPIESADDANIPLSTVDVIYKQIISDLKDAATHLSLQTDNAGRATSIAAQTMLADVYLTLGEYDKALSITSEIIENHESYGCNLISSFKTLYSPTASTNDEDIFSLKFSRVVSQGSFLAAYEAPLSYPEVAAVRAFEDAGADSEAPLLRDWDENDLRKAFNIYNTATVDGELISIDMAGDYTHLYGKQRDPEEPEETASGIDYYMYRYADVLLIFAETENLINGPTDAAYEAINKVRRRGYGLDFDVASFEADLPAGLTQDEFDNMVFRERGYEFMFEGKRWFDLIRTGRWQTIIPAAGKDLPTTLYWPFPESEILYNDSIN